MSTNNTTETITSNIESTEAITQTEGNNDAVLVNNHEMPHEARRVLVHLMRQGSIIANQKPLLFELVCRYEFYIRRHFSEVYLQLVLDTKAGVAFVANYAGVDTDDIDRIDGEEETENITLVDEDVSSLITKRVLSFYDTLLLLVLRKHYQDHETSGEQKITIDIERIESYMTPFLPLTDHAILDRKKLISRIKEMIKRKLLSAIRGSDDRYEITPIIRYVVNAEFLESMLDEYQRLAELEVQQLELE